MEGQEKQKTMTEEDPGGWREAYDSDGDLCYWHLRTRRVTWTPPPSSSSAGKRRKRKKRRKRRTSRTSSYSSRGRAHRRQRQWYLQSWLRWFSAYAVSPSFVGRPMLLSIMDGMDQKDSIHCARRRLRLWHLQSWFCWYCTSRCVPFRCRLAQDALQHGRYGPEGQFCGEKVVVIHVVAQMVSPTTAIPQLQFLDKVNDPVVRVVQVFPVVCPMCATTGALVTFRSCSSSTKPSTPLSWRRV